jgi:hypothetical protein
MPRLEGTGYRTQDWEGCDCDQLMRGQVKGGKGRSLGLHGISGREGAVHMARVGEERGKGIRGRWAGSACWPLDRLGRKPLY